MKNFFFSSFIFQRFFLGYNFFVASVLTCAKIFFVLKMLKGFNLGKIVFCSCFFLSGWSQKWKLGIFVSLTNFVGFLEFLVLNGLWIILKSILRHEKNCDEWKSAISTLQSRHEIVNLLREEKRLEFCYVEGV